MNQANTVEEVSHLQPTGQGPELFVTCASYEDRCVRSSEILGSFRPQQTVILWYDEPELSAIRTENKNAISANLSAQLGPYAKVIDMPISLLDPLSASESIVQEISVLARDHSHLSLTIDISVLTKQHLFLILRRLDSMRPQIKAIRLLYSFVDTYGFLRGRSVSRGLERIAIVPSFGGLYHLDKKNLLVLFLGFEGPRALAVYERYDPSKTIAIIGKPSYKEDWDKFSEKLNETLLEQSDVELRYTSVSSPEQVAETLRAIHREYSGEYNILISPMGTKMQGIGVYLFCESQKDVQIVLPTPIENPEKNFSQGVGRTLEYHL